MEDLYVILTINMPLSIKDLEEIFEEPMQQYMNNNQIGVIVGDGMPLDDYGPYATDIEFEISPEKLEEFKKMILNYQLPTGSVLTIGNEKMSYGTLNGIRIFVTDLSQEEIGEVYVKLTQELKGFCKYQTIYQFEQDATFYFGSNNIEKLKEKINDFIEQNSYTENMKIVLV